NNPPAKPGPSGCEPLGAISGKLTRSSLQIYRTTPVTMKERSHMKIFITGVAGFLGSHLADAMLAEGHQVVGVDNLIGGELDNVPSKVDFHQFDCNDFNHIQKVSEGCDIYYHCAATAYEGLSVFSPHFVTQNIVGASVA